MRWSRDGQATSLLKCREKIITLVKIIHLKCFELNNTYNLLNSEYVLNKIYKL